MHWHSNTQRRRSNAQPRAPSGWRGWALQTAMPVSHASAPHSQSGATGRAPSAAVHGCPASTGSRTDAAPRSFERAGRRVGSRAQCGAARVAALAQHLKAAARVIRCRRPAQRRLRSAPGLNCMHVCMRTAVTGRAAVGRVAVGRAAVALRSIKSAVACMGVTIACCPSLVATALHSLVYESSGMQLV